MMIGSLLMYMLVAKPISKVSWGGCIINGPCSVGRHVRVGE